VTAVDTQRGLHSRQAVKNRTYRQKVCQTGRKEKIEAGRLDMKKGRQDDNKQEDENIRPRKQQQKEGSKSGLQSINIDINYLDCYELVQIWVIVSK
jgi:hypothetical protein